MVISRYVSALKRVDGQSSSTRLGAMAETVRILDSCNPWPPALTDGRITLTASYIVSVATRFRDFCRLAERDEVSSECFESWVDAAGNPQLLKIMLRAVPNVDRQR